MNMSVGLTDTREQVFFKSALSENKLANFKEFFAWFETRHIVNSFQVSKVPLNQLKGWDFDIDTGTLFHKSGRFFRIEGIEVNTNFGPTPHWMQPIINQPEIGILGFLAQKINGVLHFLVQAKMEPGNINVLQLSPTVQATRSNFTQVHGGIRPPYLDYFLDRTKSRHLIDQLQSEQGSRFLRKRNRNMIVEIEENEPIETQDDFYWLTLGQMFELLKFDNLVNMDSRTVLSCIRFTADDGNAGPRFGDYDGTNFDKDVLLSNFADECQAVNDFDSIVSWVTHMKTQYNLNVCRIPLNKVEGWSYDGVAICHHSKRFFSIIGASVIASNREVQSWDQPLIESAKGGVLCFLCQRKNGILHFLVQGRVEPGNFDCVEMAPTLQFTPANYDPSKEELFPPFYEVFRKARPDQIRYDVLHSEEGGRFYHDQNRYLVIEIDEKQAMELPHNYIWMTIRQMKGFIRFNNFLNIEARGLLSCLGPRGLPKK